jgi:hypothetical protein
LSAHNWAALSAGAEKKNTLFWVQGSKIEKYAEKEFGEHQGAYYLLYRPEDVPPGTDRAV